MKKSILEVYAFSVCFVTLICLIISLGIALNYSVGVASPAFTLPSWEFQRHQSNDAFWQASSMLIPSPFPGASAQHKPRPPEPIITEQRRVSYALALEAERRNAFQTLTKAVIVIIINLIIFGIHWRLAKRAHRNNLTKA